VLNKAEIYALIALGVILAAVAAGAWERHVGYAKAVADMQEAVNKANDRADKAQQHSQEISDASATKLESIRTQHEAELDAVRKSLRYRLCELPANTAQVPRASGAPGSAHGPEPGGTLPPSLASPDFLGNFVRACQADADRLTSWQQWWIEQRAALKAAFPEMQPAG